MQHWIRRIALLCGASSLGLLPYGCDLRLFEAQAGLGANLNNAADGGPVASDNPDPLQCSLIDEQTCVWRKQGATADRMRAPELRY
jgi:hypothetical protein